MFIPIYIYTDLNTYMKIRGHGYHVYIIFIYSAYNMYIYGVYIAYIKCIYTYIVYGSPPGVVPTG